MSFEGFRTLDPYMTFAEPERGRNAEIFVQVDGTPAVPAIAFLVWVGEQRDTKRLLSTAWRIGREAYSTVAANLGYQPRAGYFVETARLIRETEKNLIPALEPMVENGQLVIQGWRSFPARTSLSVMLEHAPEGWLLEIFMRTQLPELVSGATVAPMDFDVLLSAIAVTHLDSYLAVQYGGKADQELAFKALMASVGAARLYSDVVKAAKNAASSAARRAATAGHSRTNSLKLEALQEWERTGLGLSSIAAFARIYHERFEVRERTLYGWVSKHQKAKN